MNFLLFFSLLNLSLAQSPSLVGQWLYFAKIYRGTEITEPADSTLRLHFDFTEDGVSHLYWWHVGEGDHCQRRGQYQIAGDVLVDRVTWVDPENTRECGMDPDMHSGHETRTPFHFREQDLVFHLTLGDEPLFYVWKKSGETFTYNGSSFP